MPHSFSKIWIHAIWSTKDRLPLLNPEAENQIYYIMKEEFRELSCPVKIINGMPDHVHCLFLLNPQKSVAEVIKHIKGNSSHYINQNDLMPEKFSWQKGYAAFSISESGIEKVFNYIKNQKLHHLKRGFQNELEELIRLYNINSSDSE